MVIALVVLMVVMLPVSGLLLTSDKAVANSQALAVADGLAQQRIAQERVSMATAAAFPPTSPPAYDGSCPGVGAETVDGYALVGCTTITRQVYAIWEARGWCGVGSTNSWGTTTGSADTPPEYFVQVRVSWTPTVPTVSGQVPNGQRVVVSAPILTPAGSATTGVSLSSCPLGAP